MIELVRSLLRIREDAELRAYLALLVHSFATISFFVFVSATQAFLLVYTFGVKGQNLGFVNGRISIADEVTSVFALGIWGTISDRYGRKIVLACGYTITALALFTLPSGTKWDPDYILTRILFAFGTSAMASIMAAMIGDVVTPQGLPRATSLVGIFSGVGGFCGGYGYMKIGTVMCMRSSYFVVAGICLGLGIIVVGLYWTAPQKKQPTVVDAMRGFAKIPQLVRTEPNLGLAILTSFPARAGSIVTSLYVSSWFTAYMVASGECPPPGPPLPGTPVSFCGLDTRCQKAVSAATGANGIVQGIALCAAVVVGLLLDRVRDRRVGVLGATAIGCICFICTHAVSNPRSTAEFSGLAAGFGVSQMAMIITSEVLLVHQMPAGRRGAVSACYSLVGALGVITVSVWGGDIFDTGYYRGPFVLTGAIFGLGFLLTAVFMATVTFNDSPQYGEELDDAPSADTTQKVGDLVPQTTSNQVADEKA